MNYTITEEQLKRLGTVHLLLAREIMNNHPTDSDIEFYTNVGKIISMVNLLDDNTGTKLKETIVNDLKMLKPK